MGTYFRRDKGLKITKMISGNLQGKKRENIIQYVMKNGNISTKTYLAFLQILFDEEF